MAMASAPVKANSTSKSESYVAEQLTRAQWRIRLLDLATAGFGFLAGTLIFAVLMALCDRQWHFAPQLRQLALVVYLAGAAIYLGLTVVRPLLRQINPYFAARQVEQTLPGAKNSVINWLDLRQEKLPAAVHSALGVRAARDLSHADMEKAISGRRTLVSGLLTAVLTAVFLFLFLLLGPSQFASLMRRAFAPFASTGGVVTRTRLHMLRPEGGNARLPGGVAVGIAVHVDGRVPEADKPDAVQLHWRYEPNQPYQVLPLEPQESAREWARILSVADVREGFRYRITAGDTETEEYQVTIVTAPLPTEVSATYHYRPYVGKADEVRRSERKIESLRGTEVALLVRTNRTLKSGQMVLDSRAGKRTIAGSLLDDDPHAFQVRLVIDDSGLYQLGFESTEGETYADNLLYPVIALPDRAPEVTISKPAQDTQEPINGLLRVEGTARDDIGVKGVTLQLRAVGGPALLGKEYRADKGGLKLPHGGYPLEVEYKETLELSSLKASSGQAYPLQVGMELEYWLEASDACDYTKPNVSQSKRYKVRIVEAEKDPQKQQQQRDQARKEQQEHEAKQEQKRQQEDQARRDKAQKDKEDREKNQQGMKEKPQDGAGEAKPEQGMGSEAQNNPDQGANKQPNPDDARTRQQADDINRALNEENKNQQGQQGENGDKGQAKGENGSAGSSKEGGEPKDDQQGGKEGQGENKQGGQQSDSKQAGQQKDGGQQGQQGNQQGDSSGKDGGASEAKPENKGEGKQGSDAGKGQKGAEASEGKDEGQKGEKGQQQAGKTGAAKGDDAGKQGKEAGEDKSGGIPRSKDASANRKEAGNDKGQEAAQARGENKDQSSNQTGGMRKEAGKDGPKGAEKTAEAKKGDRGPDGPRNPGESKPGPEKKGETRVSQGESKGDPEQHPPSDADLRDLKRLARDLQSPDGQKRDQAAQELDQIKKQAKDPQSRETAQRLSDLLKDQMARERAESKPESSDSNRQQPPPSGAQCSQCKNCQGGSAGAAGTAKSGDAGKGPMEPGAPKAGGQDEKTAQGNPGNEPRKPEGQGEKKDGTATAKSGGSPGQAGSPRGDNGEKSASGKGLLDEIQSQELPPRNTPGDLSKQRATEAQLEDFKKKLDKKLLDRLQMTEEAREQFLKNYADLVRRDQAGPAEKPEAPTAAQGVGTLPSNAPRPAVPGTTIPVNDSTIGPNRGQPPPGYREDYAEFNRILAGPKKK